MSAKAFGLICAAVLSAPACADSAFYAGGSLGQSRAVFGSEFDATPATSVAATETSSLAVKLFGGLEFNRHVALEGGFTRLGSVRMRTRDNATGAEQTREFRANSWNVALKAALTPTEALSLFGKFGVTRNYVKVYFSPVTTSEPEDSRIEAMYGIGIAYALSKNVSLRAEYENFGRFGKDLRSDPAATGSIKLTLWSAGLAYSFR